MIQQYIKGKSKEEIKDNLKDSSNNNKIVKCIIYKLFDLLPRDENGICFYDGTLMICYWNLIEFPDYLTVNGNLVCHHNLLTKLPEHLTVYGDLRCDNQLNGIKLELPKSAIVTGKFYY